MTRASEGHAVVRRCFCAMALVISLGTVTSSALADSIVTWKEDVRLYDGRQIVVTQRKRCDSAYTGGNYANCIARESWLLIDMPEFSAKPIEWHEHLFPIVLNVYGGRLYVVGFPPSQREFHLYGSQRPPYYAFVWAKDHWQRIPFKEIPEAIYDANMLLDHVPPAGTSHLTVSRKESAELNGDRRTAREFKRIDPLFRSNFN